MKIKILIIVTIFSIISLVFTKHRSKKLKESDKPLEAPEIRNGASTKTAHINEMMMGNPNNMVKDRSPLWKDFGDRRFNRPFMHGVVGPQWRVPTAEESNGFNIISSPMPKPELSARVIAQDLPPRTYSPTAFDLPLRKDVIQTQIPSSVTRTIETSSDPRNPPKRPVSKVSGVLYHGTSSTDPKVIHGIETNFIEKSKIKKSKKNRKNRKGVDLKSVHSARTDSLKHANSAYEGSSAVLGAIANNLVPSPHMILDAKVTNKREQPDLKLYENNHTLQRRLESLRKTPAGVRAAHTLRRLG